MELSRQNFWFQIHISAIQIEKLMIYIVTWSTLTAKQEQICYTLYTVSFKADCLKNKKQNL